VVLLRSALGSQVIAKPEINLNALGFGFDNQNDFLRLSRIFEDIGVTAYGGAAGLLSTPSIITTAARILATEAQHVASVRTQISVLNISTSALDGADLIPPPSGAKFQVLSIAHPNGLPATRTYGEVLYLAFGGQANASRGGFFPSGVNGSLTTSTGPATAANLM
jgi:Ferritin-like domain